jgi:hypothetical protein
LDKQILIKKHKQQLPIPGTRFSIPLYDKKGTKLSMSFVEIGCRPQGKHVQLNSDKELFYKYWGDNYQEQLGWKPEVYGILAHYAPTEEIIVGGRKGLDVLLQYNNLTTTQLETLTKEEIEKLLKATKGTAKSIIKLYLEHNNPKALHDLIIHGKRIEGLGTLRGTIAEILAQKDLEQQAPKEIIIQRNGIINYFNKKYAHGTEIDAVLFFYGIEPYQELIEKLRTQEHLEVKDIWH